MKIEPIVLSENEIFKTIFETEVIKFDAEETYKQPIMDQVLSKLELPYNLDYFYQKWYNEIIFNTSKQNKDFVFIHKDIKKAIQKNLSFHENRDSVEIKKRVYLTYFYSFLLADDFIKEISNLKNKLKEYTTTIDRVFLTHIIYRHCLHKQYVKLTNETGSLFYDDTIIGRIEKLNAFISKLDTNEFYTFRDGPNPTICFKNLTKYYKIHLEKTTDRNFRFITYYILDRKEEIENINRQNKIILDKDIVLFQQSNN